MIKKKLNILLLPLLVVLFINLLGTISYAYNYRITDLDCDTLIDRVVTSSYDWKPTAKTRLKTMVNNVYNNGWDTCVISLNRESYFDIAVYGFNASSVLTVKDSKNVNYMGVTTSNSTNIRYYCSKSGSSMSSISSSTWQNYSTFGSGAQKRSAYLVVPNDLGAAGELFSGPWQSSEYLVFSPPTYFELNDDINLVQYNLQNYSFSNTCYLIDFNQNQATNITIGQLGQAELLDYISVNRWVYNVSSGVFEYKDTFRPINIGTENNDIITIIFRGEDYPTIYQPDTIMEFQFVPTYTDDFIQIINRTYYIKSPNTSIVNGTIVNSNTFSGDYALIYNNDTNTAKIIDNTNDNDNVDNIIDENLSGDVNSFSQKLGYSPLENPFLSVIRFVLEGICNTLLGTGDETLEFDFHGETITINSRDFATPSSILTTFMSGVLVTFYLFAFYKYGFHIYEKLQSGEFTSVIKSFSSDNNTDYKEM